jgi:hypothetical protein
VNIVRTCETGETIRLINLTSIFPRIIMPSTKRRKDEHMWRDVRTLVCGIAVVAAGSGWISLHAAGQQRRAPAAPEEWKAPMQVSLKIGGQRYESSTPGKCTHAPVASIYQAVSELWSAEQSEVGRSLNLSFWRPKDGSADMVSLSITSGRSSHRVSTVRGAPLAGSGRVALQPSGKGGVFTVDAKTAEGAAIAGTIKCEVFAPHVAEGG